MRAKLGLFTREEDDEALVNDLLGWMQRRSADYTNTFRSLTRGRLLADATGADPELEALSSGQKLLLRMGPENAGIIKSKLRQIQAALS